MENEKREQATPATPILDSILAKLPPPSFEVKMQVQLNVVTEAYDRLSKKMEAGTLTKRDIENELSSLPAVGEIEAGKVQLVRRIQMNIDHFDIQGLPAE